MLFITQIFKILSAVALFELCYNIFLLFALYFSK